MNKHAIVTFHILPLIFTFIIIIASIVFIHLFFNRRFTLQLLLLRGLQQVTVKITKMALASGSVGACLFKKNRERMHYK